jgi:hypothetical protein
MFYDFSGYGRKFEKNADRKTLPPNANTFGKKTSKKGGIPSFLVEHRTL